MTIFLVERYWPGVTLEDLLAIAAESREAAAVMSAEGIPVRHLESTLLPEEETVFSFFEGSSVEAVERVNERVGFAFDRITEAVRVSFGEVWRDGEMKGESRG